MTGAERAGPKAELQLQFYGTEKAFVFLEEKGDKSLSGTRPRRKLSGDGRVRVCVCVCVCVPQWARTAVSRHTDMLAAIRLATTMQGVCASERTRLL